jgi:peroxiredoxin
LPDQHKKPVSLASYRGKPVILIFYLGAGCLHCTEQLTAMADRYEDFKKAGLPILAISTDDIANLKDSQDNYTKGDIPFPIVSDAPKTISKTSLSTAPSFSMEKVACSGPTFQPIPSWRSTS